MFTFQLIDLLVVLIAGAVLVSGLSFLILRRRNEILQDFLTPDEPEVEQEFFKRKPITIEEEETPPEEPDLENEPTLEEKPNAETAGWGVSIPSPDGQVTDKS